MHNVQAEEGQPCMPCSDFASYFCLVQGQKGKFILSHTFDLHVQLTRREFLEQKRVF
jgi:hypothetical protein